MMNLDSNRMRFASLLAVAILVACFATNSIARPGGTPVPGPTPQIACSAPDSNGREARRAPCGGNMLVRAYDVTVQRNWGCSGSTVGYDSGCLKFDAGGCCTFSSTPTCPTPACPCPN